MSAQVLNRGAFLDLGVTGEAVSCAIRQPHLVFIYESLFHSQVLGSTEKMTPFLRDICKDRTTFLHFSTRAERDIMHYTSAENL